MRQVCRELGVNPYNLARNIGFEQCLLDLREDVDPIRAAIEVSHACGSDKIVVFGAIAFLDCFNLQRAVDFEKRTYALVAKIESHRADHKVLEDYFSCAFLPAPCAT